MTTRKARPEPAPETANEPPEPTVDDYKRALAVLHVKMLQQARARSWCGEYEDFVKEVNAAAGFDVLGQRIRRQTINYSFSVRMRGSAAAIERAQYRFNEYLYKFQDAELINVEFSNMSDAWGVGQDETINGNTRAPDVDGMAVAGCNCETCRQERLLVAQQAAIRRPVSG